MRKLTLILSTTALALGGAGIAYANQADRNADTNGDGVVSLAEAKAKADERFARRFAQIVEKHDKNLNGS